MALQFATKCFSHLEIAHFKDNFKTLADHQDDIEYWKEETLCRFLSLPDAVKVGSVLYAMATYLGAFPFPSLAPCIVTREAMLKVVTLLTGRYKKVLKRGEHDKIKLIFKSLAVFDRRSSLALSPRTTRDTTENPKKIETSATGFSIDQPINDDEDEDDDDLALAALDALDAIEVFKEDHKQDRKVHHAHIPVYNFERLVILLLLLSPLTPQDNIAQICGGDQNLKALEGSARSIIAVFEPENDQISYTNFVRTMTILTPQLFRPLSPLFEHFLFSKQMDLSKQRGPDTQLQTTSTASRSPIYGIEQDVSSILDDILLAQLSISIDIGPTTSSSSSSFFHTGARLNQLYSIASHGTSLSSFSRQVTSWRSASLLILKATDQETTQTYILGAYIPDRWKETSTSTHTNNDNTTSDPTAAKPILFQLAPRHSIFRSNPTNHSQSSPSTVHFSPRTGISLGAILPPASRLASSPPVPGPVSLLIDTDISTATFQHDSDAGTGAFLTDPLLEESQQRAGHDAQAKRLSLDIDGLEVWGISFPEAGEEDEITKQKKRLAWEEAEAARRRGVNFGGDKDGARHLLEMAGIIGDTGRSGGSV